MNVVHATQVVFVLIYIAVIVGIVVYILMLARRLVKSHERGSAALERIAQKMGSDTL
ncbi:MAG: hypothetical protein L0H70_10520 [Xanthomonadales bacterium]|nr:hypothetical protein [Xanthomonadales bacterium]